MGRGNSIRATKDPRVSESEGKEGVVVHNDVKVSELTVGLWNKALIHNLFSIPLVISLFYIFL